MRSLTADLLMPTNTTLQLGSADLSVHYQHGVPMNAFRDEVFGSIVHRGQRGGGDRKLKLYKSLAPKYHSYDHTTRGLRNKT